MGNRRVCLKSLALLVLLGGGRCMVQPMPVPAGGPAPVAPARPTGIAGRWLGTNGVSYEITQNGDQFFWSSEGSAGRHDRGRGAIEETRVRASWVGDWGPGSAEGQISFDGNGRAVRIDWTNGVVFSR
jgi:hypothetical protein